MIVDYGPASSLIIVCVRVRGLGERVCVCVFVSHRPGTDCGEDERFDFITICQGTCARP